MSTPAVRVAPGRAELVRLARFCFVGATNTAVTLLAFAGLVSFGAPGAAASAVAFGLGGLNGYQLNARWTFSGAQRDRAVAARYGAVQLLGAALSAAGEAAGHSAGLPRLSAEIAILPAVTLFGYVLGRRFVFRDAGR